ncbi:hypothetical protein [Paenibacillus tritici]|uniref:hypothetical protein n=1 Tax=Paenibacillus tritici TaxID=1873425 RepID=UPI001565408B|nr:hypothetical protein [Paenibacillus tritici]
MEKRILIRRFLRDRRKQVDKQHLLAAVSLLWGNYANLSVIYPTTVLAASIHSLASGENPTNSSLL